MIPELKRKLNFLIHIIYKNLDENTINNYTKFKITLAKKNIKLNEKYDSNEFIIYNLYRQEAELANSLIICLAHHIDFYMRGETKKDTIFKKIYTPLLHKALDLNMLEYNELKNSNDFKKYKTIQKALETYWKKNFTSEIKILEIYNSFKVKDILKNKGFIYNPIYFCWERKITMQQLDIFFNKLTKLDPNLTIKTRDVNKIVFVVPCTICISGNTYNQKDILKNNNYIFKDKEWLKRIRADEFLNEKNKIEQLMGSGHGIKITLRY